MSDAIKLLITGGSSFLGQHLVPLALEAGKFDVCYTFFQNDPLSLPQGVRLDVRDETAVSHLIQTINPDVIIHLATTKPSDTNQDVITTGTKHVTQAAQTTNARLIHMSTDSLFDGKQAPYDEIALPNPLPQNNYGRAKAIAETIVQQHPDHVIVRTSLIYSLHLLDHGTAWMKNALQAGEPVTLFDNMWRNPVWATTLSNACLELVTLSFIGVLNIAGRQPMTRATFGLTMLDWWRITERNSLTIGPAVGEKWALDCELDLRKATAILHTPLLGVDDVFNQNDSRVK